MILGDKKKKIQYPSHLEIQLIRRSDQNRFRKYSYQALFNNVPTCLNKAIKQIEQVSVLSDEEQ